MNDATAPALPDPADLLEAGNFVTRFANGDVRNRCVRRLQALLVRVQPGVPLAVVAEWLEDTSTWLFEAGRVPTQRAGESRPLARLRFFLDALEEMPAIRSRLRTMINDAVATTHAVRLFTDTGLPSRGGFFSEFFERLARNLLPPPPVGDDLAVMLARVVHDERTAKLIVELPTPLRDRLFSMFWAPGSAHDAVMAAMREAALLIAQRLSVLGLADDVRRRSLDAQVVTSPFFRLPRVVGALLEGQTTVDGKNVMVAVGETLAACQRATRAVYGSLEATGVSVDLVFRLELIRRKIDRLNTLLLLLSPPEGLALEVPRQRFVSSLLQGAVADRSLRQHLRQNVRLLAQRVVTRAGHGGEHYITRTAAEWHQMVSSAGGGGLLTPFGVLLKFSIGLAALPLFLDGLFNSLDYALMFLALQFLHWTLATKQPAMTAAALAGALKEDESAAERDMRPLAELVARTTRSQAAAFLGNLGLVLPTVVLGDLLLEAYTGGHLLSPHNAEKVIHVHNLVHSGTVVYAVFTGFFLWLSSVAAGTVENWFVYRQLTESIATHRGLRFLLGNTRARRIGEWFRDNIQGLAGNISLGLFLGLAPAFAAFFGLPIEVRHVTFATAQLAMAGMQMGPYEVLTVPYLQAAAAIPVILLMNYASSFSLALLVALRAREVGTRDTARLIRAVWQYFREQPLDFVRPPKEPPTAAPIATPEAG